MQAFRARRARGPYRARHQERHRHADRGDEEGEVEAAHQRRRARRAAVGHRTGAVPECGLEGEMLEPPSEDERGTLRELLARALAGVPAPA